MELLSFAVVAAFLVLYSSVSKRLEQTGLITAPIVFVFFGWLVGKQVIGLIDLELENEILHFAAEITLALLLFADASQINFKLLRREQDLPVRMLTLGLAGIVALGTLVAMLIFSDLNLWQAAVLATILTPTDAALAQKVVSSPQMPVRVRQAINVESGLNDGLALPVLILFLTLAEASTGVDSPGSVIGLAASQLILGPLVGVAVGYGGGQILTWGKRKDWVEDDFLRLSALGLAMVAFGLAESVGGNGFIAAFVAGLVVGTTAGSITDKLHDFAEIEGRLLTIVMFTIFGAIMLPIGLANLDWRIIVYALLSLTVVRIIPIVLSLIGVKEDLQWETYLMFGWFGPRGIASIIYVLVAINENLIAGTELIVQVVAVTIALSVLLHGMSAAPLTHWYHQRVDRSSGAEAHDTQEVEEQNISEQSVED